MLCCPMFSFRLLADPPTKTRVFASVPALLFGVYRGTRVTPAEQPAQTVATRPLTPWAGGSKKQQNSQLATRPLTPWAGSDQNPQLATRPLTPWAGSKKQKSTGNAPTHALCERVATCPQQQQQQPNRKSSSDTAAASNNASNAVAFISPESH